jgi:hypothetical protein
LAGAEICFHGSERSIVQTVSGWKMLEQMLENAGKIDEMKLRSNIVGTGKRLMPLTILCTMGNLI